MAISYRGSGVFMVEGTFGRERRADIGVKERKGKGEGPGTEDGVERRETGRTGERRGWNV